MKGVLLHFAAPNTPNGNPNRIYVAVNTEGEIEGVWNEGYIGIGVVPEYIRENFGLFERISVKASVIKEFRADPSY